MGPDIDSTAQRGPSGPQEAGDPAAEQQSAFKQHWLSLAFSGRCGRGAAEGPWGRGSGGALT
jgi:hypothetical protein